MRNLREILAGKVDHASCSASEATCRAWAFASRPRLRLGHATSRAGSATASTRPSKPYSRASPTRSRRWCAGVREAREAHVSRGSRSPRSPQRIARFCHPLAQTLALPTERGQVPCFCVKQNRPSSYATRPSWNAMKEGLLGDTLHSVHRGASSRRPVIMLHAGLDLSRNRLDVCLLSDHGEVVEVFAPWLAGCCATASRCAESLSR
jgi:hypothetical protein